MGAIELNWINMKGVISAASLPYKYYEISGNYYIYARDGEIHFQCIIRKDGGDDQTDFETSYKSGASPTVILTQQDSDGAMIVRNKAAMRGWTFCSLPFEFETARLSDTLYSKDSAGNSRSFITLKAYDSDNNEVTTPGIAGANYASICKTVIDFEPPYDYEVIGGDLRTLSTISSDLRLWLIAAPDIAAPTGSKEMGGGINLRYLAPGNVWSVDGRVTKYATYNAVYHTGKIRLILKYPAGTNESLQVIVQLYKL